MTYPCHVGLFLSIFSSRRTIRNSDEVSSSGWALFLVLRGVWPLSEEETRSTEGSIAEASDLNYHNY